MFPSAARLRRSGLAYAVLQQAAGGRCGGVAVLVGTHSPGLPPVAALVLPAAAAGALFVSAYLAVFEAVDGAVVLALGAGAGCGVFGVPVGTYHSAPNDCFAVGLSLRL